MKFNATPSTQARRRALARAALAWGLAAAAPLALAQTATIYGQVGNFDVVNNTGQNACGFELQIEGVQHNPSTYTYNYTRYGAGQVTALTNAAGAVTGTRVQWKSSDCSFNRTVPHAPNTGFIGTCYGTGDAGCEHFGASVGLYATSKVTARWLVRDPANAAAYVPHDPPMAIPMPYYALAPAPALNAAPVVVDVVPAPVPPPAPARFGNAQWMKVYVRQMPRAVTLDELLTTNPLVVPMAAAQLEFDWKLMQDDPSVGGRRNRNRSQGGSTLNPTTRAVVKRYEMYEYTGAVDPVTNEALCADLLCNAPGAGELGDFISAQMSAVNVQGDFITVAKAGTGGGNVDSADKRIACGNKCSLPYAAGTVVTLVAKANSGSVFAGWTGACTGTSLTCNVTINGANTATAVFNTQAAGGGGGGGGGTVTPPAAGTVLSVSLGKPGTVTSSPAGINCGSVCAATFATGTVVTLTATPLPGQTFTGWSGACGTSLAPVCTVTMSKALSTKANFSK